MPKKLTPLIVGALVAALASTTGYCVIQKDGSGVPPVTVGVSPPVRLLPPATIPYQPADEDATDGR